MIFGAIGATNIHNALKRIFGKSETAKLQLFRSHRDSRKALFGRAVCHRFRTLTPYPTELRTGWRPTRQTAQSGRLEAEYGQH